jgi:hypothetical protein
VAGDVEMEMVLMKPVGFRPQNGAERPARAFPDTANVGRSFASPTFQHGNGLTIGKAEVGDIDGVAFGVLT